MKETIMLREIPTNYYTRKKELEKEFLAGLRERKIDEKFSYIGERQANAWFDICNSPEYAYYIRSKKLLQNTVKNFVADLENHVNVIALGPGNAIKERIIVETLQEKQVVDLFFVDISREVTNVAVENIIDTNSLQEIFIADLRNFEDIAELSRYVRDQYNATSFFTLLGNTLGNYPQAVILKTIRNAMRPGDKILIDVHIKLTESIEKETAKINESLREYKRNPTYLEKTLASISGAGITIADGTIEAEFSKDEFFPQIGVVKQYFRFTRNKVVTYRGEDIRFAEGERILVHFSNKYTFESLATLFASQGLRIVKDAKDEGYYQLLCELA